MNKIYSQKREKGKCSSCGNDARPGRAFCEECAKKRTLTFRQKRESGVCTECTRNTVPGKTRCEYHLEQRSRYQKNLADNRIANDLCPNCGKHPLNGEKMLCEKCRQRGLRNINNKHFGGNRDSVLERDHYQCQICNKVFNLVVHHKDDHGDNPNHDPSNLITLCRHCHAAITKLRSNNRELAAQLILM